jgi:hypothetical protein
MMSSSSTITLIIPRAEKESLFLQRVVQAAIHAYRTDHNKKDKVNPDRGVDDRGGDTLRPFTAA